MSRAARSSPGASVSGTSHLLEAIGRCELCGGRINIHGAWDKNSSHVYRYYLCVNRRRARYGERCALPLLRVEDVDARIWAAVSKFVSRPDLVAEAVARRDGVAGADAQRAAVDLEGWKRQIERLSELENDALVLCRRGVLSREARDRELVKIAQQRRMLEQQVEAAQEMAGSVVAERQSVADLMAWLGKLRDRLEDATAEVRREIVLAVVPGRGDYFFTVGAEEIVGRALLGKVTSVGAALEMQLVA